MSSSRIFEIIDHGVRKYDDGLGRFTCPDALWEKYYSWTPYQYSMNNPVNAYDENGKWVNEIGDESHRHSGKLNRSSNGYLANKINYEFYNKWQKTAPNVANFVKNNDLFVMQADLPGIIGGSATIGSNLAKFDINDLGNDFEKAALHETVHNMGEGEFGAFGAQLAAGYGAENLKTLLNFRYSNITSVMKELTEKKNHYIQELKESAPKGFDFSKYQDKYGDINDVNGLFKEMESYGKKIIGKE